MNYCIINEYTRARWLRGLKRDTSAQYHQRRRETSSSSSFSRTRWPTWSLGWRSGCVHDWWRRCANPFRLTRFRFGDKRFVWCAVMKTLHQRKVLLLGWKRRGCCYSKPRCNGQTSQSLFQHLILSLTSSCLNHQKIKKKKKFLQKDCLGLEFGVKVCIFLSVWDITCLFMRKNKAFIIQ